MRLANGVDWSPNGHVRLAGYNGIRWEEALGLILTECGSGFLRAAIVTTVRKRGVVENIEIRVVGAQYRLIVYD